MLAERAPDLPASAFGITGHAEPSVVFAVGTGTHLLPTGGDAARFLAEAPGRVVAVGNRAEADFQREAAALGLLPKEIGTVTGLNYTRGRWVTLILYQPAVRDAPALLLRTRCIMVEFPPTSSRPAGSSACSC